MRLPEPLEVRPGSAIGEAHPLAKLAAAAGLMLALFLTVDVVTSGVVLAALVAAFPFTGLPLRAFLRRVAPLAFAAVGIAIVNAVLGDRGALGGAAVAFRLLGIALAGVIAVATIDPTDLADALVEHLHAPPRLVLGTLATWRLAPLFGLEWRTLGLARRARGIEADRTPGDRLRDLPGRSFALLVGAIRRGTRLALALDARGFGRRRCRTLARPRAIERSDWAVLAAALLVAAGATGLSIALGSWRPLLSF